MNLKSSTARQQCECAILKTMPGINGSVCAWGDRCVHLGEPEITLHPCQVQDCGLRIHHACVVKFAGAPDGAFVCPTHSPSASPSPRQSPSLRHNPSPAPSPAPLPSPAQRKVSPALMEQWREHVYDERTNTVSVFKVTQCEGRSALAREIY